MDIIDIILAKAASPQAQVETYAARMQEALEEAQEAVAQANAAVERIENAGEPVDSTFVDEEINKVALSIAAENTNDTYSQTITMTMPDGETEKAISGIGKLYKNIGENEDGSMTQKAIKDYFTTAVAEIEIGENNFGSDNDGKLVKVDGDGNIVPSTISENELIDALMNNGDIAMKNALGLEVDYANKSFTRIEEAAGKNMGSDFNSYVMYGGRRRCTVGDDGHIIAFYGDPEYREDSANEQVMIYQPKFYYRRVPSATTENKVGKIVETDSFIISATPQTGFKVHPIFLTPEGEELDYVLFGAYEGGLYSTESQGTYRYVTDNVNFNEDKLVSKAGVKPLTGSSSLSLQKAEQLANNRGEGWHIFTLKAESANQMLELVEFGTLNGQAALGKGISLVTSTGNYNCSALTGATTTLGNESGAAPLTYVEINSNVMQYSIDGKNSISYRGMENPWGNTWTMLADVIVFGDRNSNSGVPYICKDYNYSYNALSNNYESVNFSLPNDSGWISALGYGSSKYDWVLMPAATSSKANSVGPVGDNGWFDSDLSGIRMVVHGGSWSFEESNGPFYYGCDKMPTDSTYKSYGVRLMYIPQKNEIYTANIEKWQNQMN